MKITVKQLKQLIREQVEEMAHDGAMEAREARAAQPTIGEYIDQRLFSMASDGAFSESGTLTKRDALEGIIEDYMDRYKFIKYEK
jgi:hypothetical protein